MQIPDGNDLPSRNPARSSQMSIYAIALSIASGNAFAAAAPDLAPSFTAPTGAYVYQSAKWTVKVSNVGTKNSTAATLSIQLPVTHTSPTVYVMGTLGAKSTNCTASGTKLNCSIPAIVKGSSTSVYFYMSLPESTASLDFSATTTLSTDTNSANNTATNSASLFNYSPTFTGTHTMINRHCTGTGLTAFFECETAPSSISSHEAMFNSDGTVTISGAPEYGGSWAIVGDELSFNYTEYGTVIAEFEGYGVDSNCWEGITTFGTSAYVSPYEVCL